MADADELAEAVRTLAGLGGRVVIGVHEAPFCAFHDSDIHDVSVLSTESRRWLCGTIVIDGRPYIVHSVNLPPDSEGETQP
jgi:hypothetical protein